MKITKINDILLLAQQKGIRSGEIRITIINGVIKDTEYLVKEWEYRPNIDGIVDNSQWICRERY